MHVQQQLGPIEQGPAEGQRIKLVMQSEVEQAGFPVMHVQQLLGSIEKEEKRIADVRADIHHGTASDCLSEYSPVRYIWTT